MTNPKSQTLGLVPKLVVVAAAVLIGAGLIWHDITLGALHRFWNDLMGRPTGPMAVRFILQPGMAAIAAMHDGINDARLRRSPYLWTVMRNPKERADRLREALNATARIILLGLAIDGIYQLIVLKTFYPVEALIVALVLAFVPYVLLRGPAARIERQLHADVQPDRSL